MATATVLWWLVCLFGMLVGIGLAYALGYHFLGDHALWVLPLGLILLATLAYVVGSREEIRQRWQARRVRAAWRRQKTVNPDVAAAWRAESRQKGSGVITVSEDASTEE